MTMKEMLSDEELEAQANQWRRRALQGELHARGIAQEHAQSSEVTMSKWSCCLRRGATLTASALVCQVT